MSTKSLVVGLIVICAILALSGIVDGKSSSSVSKSSAPSKISLSKTSYKQPTASSPSKGFVINPSAGSKKSVKTPVTKTTIRKIKYHNHDYNEVYFGPGYDVVTLMALGFVFLAYEADGDALYVNNLTNEIVEVDNSMIPIGQRSQNQIPQQSSGFESFIVILGIISMGLALRRN